MGSVTGSGWGKLCQGSETPAVPRLVVLGRLENVLLIDMGHIPTCLA